MILSIKPGDEDYFATAAERWDMPVQTLMEWVARETPCDPCVEIGGKRFL